MVRHCVVRGVLTQTKDRGTKRSPKLPKKDLCMRFIFLLEMNLLSHSVDDILTRWYNPFRHHGYGSFGLLIPDDRADILSHCLCKRRDAREVNCFVFLYTSYRHRCDFSPQERIVFCPQHLTEPLFALHVVIIINNNNLICIVQVPFKYAHMRITII